MTVCPRHHKNLTTARPADNGLCVATQVIRDNESALSTQTRRVNGKMSHSIFELHNAVVPIGSGLFYVN